MCFRLARPFKISLLLVLIISLIGCAREVAVENEIDDAAADVAEQSEAVNSTNEPELGEPIDLSSIGNESDDSETDAIALNEAGNSANEPELVDPVYFSTFEDDIVGSDPFEFISKNIGNSMANHRQTGYIASDEEWVYFWPGSTEYHAEDYFAKMKHDGSEFTIIDESKPCYINIVGEWIYFIQQNRYDRGFYGPIYKMRKDGTEKQLLYNEHANSMIVVGSTIYFISQDDFRIRKMNTDGTGLVKLNDSRSHGMFYEDGWLYYSGPESDDSSDRYLYRLNVLEASEPEQIMANSGFVQVDDGQPYIWNWESDKLIYRLGKDDTLVPVFLEPAESFMIDNGLLYTITNNYDLIIGSKGDIQIVNLNGSGQSFIPIDRYKDYARSSFAGVSGGYIYYWAKNGETFYLARVRSDGEEQEHLYDRVVRMNSIPDNDLLETVIKPEPAGKVIGNTPSHLNAGGFIASDGEWDYFWLGKHDTYISDDDQKFVKMKKNGDEMHVIANTKASYINIVGDWIYYLKKKSPVPWYDYGPIYKMKKDGSENQLLYNAKASAMVVVDDRIYFIVDDHQQSLYKMNTDGSGLVRLGHARRSKLFYEDGWLYYSGSDEHDNRVIYRMNTVEGTEPELVMKESRDFVIHQGNLFYWGDNEELYVFDFASGHAKLVIEEPTRSSVLEDNLVYTFGLTQVSYDRLLYQIRLDDQFAAIEPRTVLDLDQGYSLAGVSGDYIYYWITDRDTSYDFARVKKDGSGEEVLTERFSWQVK